MKKRFFLYFFLYFFLLFLIAVLCTAIPCVVFAHSGRTDGDGGHTDHSTGEYHYHHGYPAHDHYDMDGNGTIDCPYNFVDATDHSHGSGSSHSSSTSHESTRVITEIERVYVDKPYVPTWWIVLFFLTNGTLILTLVLVIKAKNNRYKSMQESYEHTIATKVRDISKEIENTYSKTFLYDMAHVPSDSYIDAVGCPAQKDKKELWGEKYTFYRGSKSIYARYHTASCRYAVKSLPVNAYYLSKGEACYFCNPQLPDCTWVDRYHYLSRLFEVK